LIVAVLFPIATVAVRAAPLFGSTVTRTVPLPVSRPDPRTVTQDASLVAAQAHSESDAVTLIDVAAPPPAPIDCSLGAISTMQRAAPATALCCVRRKVCPAITTVPLRWPLLLAATDSTIVPLPWPACPLVIPIHEAWLVADQLHAAAVVSSMDAGPPLESIARVMGAIS
jgi:hypothetical protein